jgi:hypothetical protein
LLTVWIPYASCQYGKAHWKSDAQDNGSITQQHDFPGAGVSADQLEAGSPGKIPMTKRQPTSKRYKYCNLWIDHFSKYMYITFHETKDASKVVKSKTKFQQFLLNMVFIYDLLGQTTELMHPSYSKCHVSEINKIYHSTLLEVTGKMVSQNVT